MKCKPGVDVTENVADLIEEVNAINWFHSIDLGNGIVTPGNDDSPAKLRQLGLPSDLTGMTVLDIGAWDGFFSFEAERRGAKRVLAVDEFCWGGEGCGTQAGFNLARRILKSSVEDRQIDVLSLSPECLGAFDVVLFLGVLYHMKRPLTALRHVASVTKDLLVLETHVDLLDVNVPAVAVYPNRELDDDPTNWCGPNLLALKWMLEDVGFADVKFVFQSPMWWRAGRALKLAAMGRSNFWAAYRQGRVVVHARKNAI